MNVRPGEWCAMALFGAAIAMDVVLKRRGHDSISTCVRSNEHARRVVRWLSAHLTDSVKGDPLTWLGGRF